MSKSYKDIAFTSAYLGKAIPMLILCSKSFIRTLKDEEVYLWDYKTIEDA